MGKNMYSLILSEDVINAVDRLAYQQGTSRSALVNRILAEYVSYQTPEQRLQEVFTEIENLLSGNGTFRMLMKPSDSMLSLRSVLTYKYSPSVRYSVEMATAQDSSSILRLKVLLRSKNQALVDYVTQFFSVWQAYEQAAGRKLGVKVPRWMVQDARFIRTLRLPEEEESGESFGQRIADYIKAVDSAMNTYLSCLPDEEEAEEQVLSEYREYLQKVQEEAGERPVKEVLL